MNILLNQAQAFDEFYRLMLAQFPEDWSLPHKILRELAFPDAQLPLEKLYELTRASTPLGSLNLLPPQAFETLAGHALSLLRATSVHLYIEGKNAAAHYLSCDTQVSWTQEPARMETMVSAKAVSCR